jgi:hypothetical protein
VTLSNQGVGQKTAGVHRAQTFVTQIVIFGDRSVNASGTTVFTMAIRPVFLRWLSTVVSARAEPICGPQPISTRRRVFSDVGTNNSGKSTILEAISVLLSVGDPTAIWSILARRGEDLLAERDPNASLPTSRQLEVRCLFRGHGIEAHQSFSLVGVESLSN